MDSVYVNGKNYYAQVFLEKYKHVVRKKKMPHFITNDTEIYFDYSDDCDEKN